MVSQCHHAANGDQALSDARFLELAHRDDRGEKSVVGPAAGFPPSLLTVKSLLYFFLRGVAKFLKRQVREFLLWLIDEPGLQTVEMKIGGYTYEVFCRPLENTMKVNRRWPR